MQLDVRINHYHGPNFNSAITHRSSGIGKCKTVFNRKAHLALNSSLPSPCGAVDLRPCLNNILKATT